MSTPQQQLSRGPRRSARKNKGPNVPNGGPRVTSDNEASLSQDQMSGTDQVVHQGRKKSQAHNNKVHNSGHTSDNPQPSKTQATPIKQAYAGPTFHHSPAASALPMPSFYSRSVPAQAPVPIVEDLDEPIDVSLPTESTPTKRESTPLDFLFDAARQARGGSPAAHSGNQSIPPRSPAGKSPAPRDESMFPFELDGASTPGSEGVPSTFSYKERMASAKSTPIADGTRDMDEFERRAKSDALKKLLMHQSPQGSPMPHDPNNPFNARAPQPRHRSGPNTPSQFTGSHEVPDHYFANANNSMNKHYVLNNIPPRPSSHLRYEAASEPEPAELSSDNTLSPPRISTARRQANHTDPPTQAPYNHPMSPPGHAPGGIPTAQLGGIPPGLTPPERGMFDPNYGPPPWQHQGNPRPPGLGKQQGHKSKPSAQQLEDDLRRVLNLNVASKG
jgi:hypothetical protein